MPWKSHFVNSWLSNRPVTGSRRTRYPVHVAARRTPSMPTSTPTNASADPTSGSSPRHATSPEDVTRTRFRTQPPPVGGSSSAIAERPSGATCKSRTGIPSGMPVHNSRAPSDAIVRTPPLTEKKSRLLTGGSLPFRNWRAVCAPAVVLVPIRQADRRPVPRSPPACARPAGGSPARRRLPRSQPGVQDPPAPQPTRPA